MQLSYSLRVAHWSWVVKLVKVPFNYCKYSYTPLPVFSWLTLVFAQPQCVDFCCSLLILLTFLQPFDLLERTTVPPTSYLCHITHMNEEDKTYGWFYFRLRNRKWKKRFCYTFDEIICRIKLERFSFLIEWANHLEPKLGSALIPLTGREEYGSVGCDKMTSGVFKGEVQGEFRCSHKWEKLMRRQRQRKHSRNHNEYDIWTSSAEGKKAKLQRGAEALAYTQLQHKRGNSTSVSEFHREPRSLEALLMRLLLSQKNISHYVSSLWVKKNSIWRLEWPAVSIDQQSNKLLC